MKKTQISEMSWYEFRDAMAMNDLVIIPVGTMEAHGKHAPLGTGKMIVDIMARKIGEKAGVPVAPTVPFSASRNIGDFPGTLCMDPNLLRQVLVEIAESYYAHGARRFLYINAGSGNCGAVKMACSDMQKMHNDVLSVQSEWWKVIPQLTKYACNGHGDKFDTSVLMAIDEALCDISKAEKGEKDSLSDAFDGNKFCGGSIPIMGGVSLSDVNDTGCYGADAIEATKEIGEDIIEIYVDYCAKLCKELKRVFL